MSHPGNFAMNVYDSSFKQFSTIEKDLLQYTWLEVSYSDGIICFRQSKKNADSSMALAITFSAGWAVLAAGVTYSIIFPISKSLVLLTETIICAAFLYSVKILMRTRKQYTYFYCDLVKREIVPGDIHQTESSNQSIDVESIYAFYAWDKISGDDTYSSVYAVDNSDKVTVLIESGSESYVEQLAKSLGFLFDRPVFKHRSSGHILSLDFADVPNN